MPPREGYVNPLAFTISLCLCFTVCVASLRLWIRRNAYGVDDALIGVATLVSLGHTATGYVSLMAGLGKPWEKIVAAGEGGLGRLNQASIANIILFFIPLYLSKCAMLSFLGRITKTPSQILLYRICNFVVGTLGVVSIILATAGCPTRPLSGWYWAFNINAARCGSQDLRWQIITALDILTELLLLALPVHLVWKLQMPWTKKAMIIIAFWIRLPALAFSLTRNFHTLQLRHHSTLAAAGEDAGLDAALVAIWLEIELSYALAASTLSALKAFMESFDSGFGLGFTRGKGEGSGSGNSYGMSGISGVSSSSSGSGRGGEGLGSGGGGGGDGGAARSNLPLFDGGSGRVGYSFPPVPPIPVPHRRQQLKEEKEEEEQLKLRPNQTTLTSHTTISSPRPTTTGGGNFGDISLWRQQRQRTNSGNSNMGSERSDEEEEEEDQMVIHRDLAFEVLHDEAPMLLRR